MACKMKIKAQVLMTFDLRPPGPGPAMGKMWETFVKNQFFFFGGVFLGFPKCSLPFFFWGG